MPVIESKNLYVLSILRAKNRVEYPTRDIQIKGEPTRRLTWEYGDKYEGKIRVLHMEVTIIFYNR